MLSSARGVAVAGTVLALVTGLVLAQEPAPSSADTSAALVRSAVALGPVEPVTGKLPARLQQPAAVTDHWGVTTVVWGRSSARRSRAGHWTRPTGLPATPDRTVQGARVGVDARGTVTAVWEESDRGENPEIMLSTRPVGRGWSAPLNLTVGRPHGSGPQLSVAATGAAVLTWAQPDATQSSGSGVVAVHKSPKGSWATARRVLMPGFYSVESTAISAAGTSLIAGYDAALVTTRVSVRRFVPGRGWLRRVRLGSGDWARVAMDRRGRAVVTWTASYWNANRSVVRARMMTRSGRWLPARSLSPQWRQVQGAQAVTTMDDRGVATAAWLRGRGLYVARKTPRGRWAVRRVLRHRTPALVLHDLATDGRGDLALTWSTGYDRTPTLNVMLRRRGGSWSTSRPVGHLGSVETIDEPFYDDPDLVVLPDGTALPVWLTPGFQLLARAASVPR